MTLKKYEDLTAVHLDVLKEVGNIGSGNASTALSAMIGKNVLIEMPKVKLLDFQDAIDQAGGAETVIAGILVRLSGDIDGMILFLIEQEFAEIIIKTFFGKEHIDLLALDENDVSTLSEIGNIMASSYVGAIAQLAGIQINVEAPSFTADMLGAVMSVPAIEFGEVSDKLLFIDKSLKIDDVSVKSNMMLIPTVESLAKLLGKLGVEA
ncbi:MAG: chemotaxis protein CheC [Ruminiclostridium sp.]